MMESITDNSWATIGRLVLSHRSLGRKNESAGLLLESGNNILGRLSCPTIFSEGKQPAFIFWRTNEDLARSGAYACAFASSACSAGKCTHRSQGGRPAESRCTAHCRPSRR